MLTLKGTPVCKGIAIGRLFCLNHQKTTTVRKGADQQEELARCREARREACAQLASLYEEAVETVGEENAQLFEIHQMLIEDPDFVETMEGLITEQGMDAESAVSETGRSFADLFSQMDDPYMRARASDFQDIAQRIRRILTGEASELEITEPVILAADELFPSETAKLDRNKILAIVTSGGTSNGHTAIFARSMGIPAVIGVTGILDAAGNGGQAAVDAAEGCVYLAPEPELLDSLLKKRQAAEEKQAQLRLWRDRPTLTADGKRVHICANIGSVADLDMALENGAEGVGLFRSEFLYLGRSDFPDEEVQFTAYREAAQRMDGKRVVIRTLDIGADKQIPYFHQEPEENPALGVRAIRYCLRDQETFRTQLRALYRASAFGKVAIMFPMISSVDEVLAAKALCYAVMEDLRKEGLPFCEATEIGIMVETPAAALLSDQLAPLVDFFSVGSNDLTQYTLAMDRQNPLFSALCSQKNEAVLRLIQLAVTNARNAGIWCGICGELGANPEVTEQLVKYGMDEFSVAAPSILPLRQAISQITAQHTDV